MKFFIQLLHRSFLHIGVFEILDRVYNIKKGCINSVISVYITNIKSLILK